MAKIILGSMITNIAGSIGGTTFKRSPSGIVMMNKNAGGSKISRLKNNYVVKLGNIFRRWTYLDESTKNAWNAYALTMTFPDKFGNPKYLSGRELFIKCNSNLAMYNATITLPNDYSAFIPDYDITEVFLDITTFQCEVDLILNDYAGNIRLYVEKIPYANCSYAKPKSKVFYKQSFNDNVNIDLWEEFTNKFPSAKSGDVFRFFFVSSSYNGLSSAPFYVDRMAN